jgi:hypothetical protein
LTPWVDEFDTRRRFLEQQNASDAISADSLDLRVILVADSDEAARL